MDRFILGVCALLTTASAVAQVSGLVKVIPYSDELSKGKPGSTYSNFTPLCNGDGLVFYLDDFLERNGIRSRSVLRAFDVDAGKAIAAKPIEFEGEKGISKDVRTFFLAGNKPAIVHKAWNNKSGEVGLFAQSFDPQTLEASASIKIGSIPFDPKSYGGGGPVIRVVRSSDNSKLLFYFDRIKLQGVQLVMCWVTDNDFEPIWSGVYRVPAQSEGFSASVDLADDGGVYLSVEAVLLTEDAVKEKSDGSIKVKTKSLKNKEVSVFKLHEKEFLHWDGMLEGGMELHGVQLSEHQGVMYYGGVGSIGDAERPTSWVTGRLGPDLSPSATTVIPFRSKERQPRDFHHFAMGDKGRKYLVGYAPGYTTVCSISPDGELDWESVVKWEELEQFPLGRSLVVVNGLARMFAYNLGSQDGAKRPDEVIQKSIGNTTPLMITFKEDGQPVIQELANKDHGAARRMLYTVWPHYDLIPQCGFFVEACYDSKVDGVYVVPIH